MTQVRLTIKGKPSYLSFASYDAAYAFVYAIPYMQARGDKQFLQIERARIEDAETPQKGPRLNEYP